MAYELIDALKPILDDVETSRLAVSLHVRHDEIEEPFDGYQRTTLWASDGSGTGIQISLQDAVGERIVKTANVVQDIVIEDFTHAPWPACPLHPHGGHPLLAESRGAVAAWVCPTTGDVVAPVGGLGS